MKKIKHLLLLQKILHNKVDVAAKKLAEGQRKVKREMARLDQLGKYRQEYRDYFLSLKDQSAKTAQHVSYTQAFIQHLLRLQKVQKIGLQNIQAETERRRQAWLYLHNRAKALGDYIARLNKQHKDYVNNQEQKQLDQLVQDCYHIVKKNKFEY